jgi:E3 ubiquitin-protein ligase HECTD1
MYNIKRKAEMVQSLLDAFICFLLNHFMIGFYVYSQILTRRLRFKFEKGYYEQPYNENGAFGPIDDGLVDRTGRSLKMEPLATVDQLERFLLRMVARQWYDYERSTFHYMKYLQQSAPISLTFDKDFDANGLMYWIGTNGK